MPRIALYPGSFDPVTNGHLDVVRHAVILCDRLVVAIGVNSSKKPLFSTEERLEMVRAVFEPVATKAGCALDCTTYDNLTVAAAQKHGAAIMIRGLRDGTDLDFDMQNAIVVDTTKGRIVFKLRTDLAPKHAERIKQLARDGFYDNVPFHRVMDGFMAQTGDGQNFNGTGGSKYPTLKAE